MTNLYKYILGGILGLGGMTMIITGIAFSIVPIIVIGVPFFMAGAIIFSIL
jgi:hypothetical protein